MDTTGILSIVATPIGNLDDITQRALMVLRSSDLILAEDTRVTKRLLDRYEITTPCTSFHQHSSDKSYMKAIDALRAGKHVAVVSDAGTPGISDPGNMLVERVYAELGTTVRIEPIPGPSAVTAALSVAGMPTDRFTFFGFIPHKKGKNKMLQQIAESEYTAVFYESPHRIEKTLTALLELLEKERIVVVAREITKKFETIYRGTIREVLEQVQNKQKGEFVIIISGK